MRDNSMTEEIRNILLGIGVMAVLLVASCELRATDSEYLKQILRPQFSEVCSTPLPKGDALPNALNEALKADAKTWLPWVLWWNATREKYEKAKCGEA
jgi:hypothetical protein